MKGFSQVKGIDYDEIFSPVVCFETVRLMMALAALEHWHIQGLDVKNTFLYGNLDEEIYMDQPEGFRNGSKVWCLKKALYKLKQASHSWWKAVRDSMRELGFTSVKSDAGVFYYNKKGIRIYAVVYVDDTLFMLR